MRGARRAARADAVAVRAEQTAEVANFPSAAFGQAMRAVLIGVADAEITDLLKRFERDREGNVTFEAFSATK